MFEKPVTKKEIFLFAKAFILVIKTILLGSAIATFKTFPSISKGIIFSFFIKIFGKALITSGFMLSEDNSIFFIAKFLEITFAISSSLIYFFFKSSSTIFSLFSAHCVVILVNLSSDNMPDVFKSCAIFSDTAGDKLII